MTREEAFEKFARGIEERAPDTAVLMRRCARDPVALTLIPLEPTWDAPHRVLAAVRWLLLDGQVEDYRDASDPWEAFRAILVERAEFVRTFVWYYRVQTNEVQRCFALLPLFLTVARTVRMPLDLIELGASAGLNLLWDRYRYRYREGTWGPEDATLELTGEERAPVPASLLEERVQIRRRRGIDLNPVDVTSDDGVRMLLAFSSDDVHARLLRAVEAARRDPPEVWPGDYLDRLPQLLEDRDDGALTVVFQTLSTVYLADEERARLRELVDAAGEEGPLAWISTPTPEEHGQRRGDYPLELATWPGGERRIAARMDNRGEWLEWIG